MPISAGFFEVACGARTATMRKTPVIRSAPVSQATNDGSNFLASAKFVSVFAVRLCICKKAVELFQVNQNPGTAPELPLAMIEGVDDAAADLLDELGISTVQHLATQSPVELSMRSLYPIKRVIDWIDQALLTLYFRDKIVAARELGLRGMTEFIAVYEQATGIHPGKADQSKELMTVLAQKLGMSESALYLMADACRHDDSVKFLYDLRHFNEEAEGKTPPPQDEPQPVGDDRIRILKTDAATPSNATVNAGPAAEVNPSAGGPPS
jgi:hypothetical protein